VGQLLTLLDGTAALVSAPAVHAGQAAGGAPRAPGHILVVAATSRPNAIDPALRRAGRCAAWGLHWPFQDRTHFAFTCLQYAL